ncbi:unnamed protein product [Tuber melanosporum]|uniref:Transcription initiation factor IIF subunit beta n=1 Tax=Tuber melanosporum (strain Mel28) TaxID=656061 RepID=D5GM47_TUBMM|nr:uncharacterized protein GSTUM_00010523001 [Tuber melanosporum]KAG0125101.1 transcription initiation factor IIF, beta subunit-domain-containing protein [Tuber indicum]CAZ85590.1 unnamed protein product [Tuber melanosporum]
MATNGPAIKPDPDVKIEDADIKAEVLDADDDELYEDAGDLDMSKGDKAVWLVKLPSFVAERWNEIDDNEEIVLGVVKVNPKDTSNLKLSLERNQANGDEIPTEYDLRITNMEVNNTFVFTEKDMPGFSSKLNTGGVKEGEPAIPARLLYQHRDRESNSGGGGGGKGNWGKQRYQPYVRKAIPKRTSLVGTVRHECSMSPVINEEYKRFQLSKFRQADAPRVTTQVLDPNAAGGNLLAPGTTGATAKSFAGFVKPTQAVRKTTDNKAARMPHSELLTALFSLFAEHEYWSMRGIRERLFQPEQYLKQTLDEIAKMDRNGPFTGKWSLKSEYKNTDDKKKLELAASTGGEAGQEVIEIDDDDEMVEMEDVLK